MPFDSMPQGKPWGDPWSPRCRSCKRPIGKDEPTEEVRITNDPERKLVELNGTYHADCARPFLSLARIVNMKFPF